MRILDAHQHFWKYDPVRDSWITPDMEKIRRDFLPGELHSLLQKNKVEGSVVVQSDQSEEENTFQLKNADQNSFIRGVVGWVDFKSPCIGDKLSYYRTFPKMKGFRHILQGEAQRDYMLNPKFMYGINLLKEYEFTYDILVFPDQLKFTETFVKAFPDQKFVIDHIAKPNIKGRKIDEWKKGIETLAACPNLYCKISGMVTEADWANWKKEEIYPYLDVVLNAFGIKRLMFGSDWPVCLVAGEYEDILALVESYFSSFSENELTDLWAENAINFYNL